MLFQLRNGGQSTGLTPRPQEGGIQEQCGCWGGRWRECVRGGWPRDNGWNRYWNPFPQCIAHPLTFSEKLPGALRNSDIRTQPSDRKGCAIGALQAVSSCFSVPRASCSTPPLLALPFSPWWSLSQGRPTSPPSATTGRSGPSLDQLFQPEV